MLERRKQVMQVLRFGLRPGLLLQDEGRALAVGERRLPFTIFAVERQDPIAGLEAQHVAEIMRLRFVERDLRPGLERARDVEPGTLKVVFGQSDRP